MALIKCPECGKQFSDKAPACPNCGCPTSEFFHKNENDFPIKELNTGLGKIIAYNKYVKLIPLNLSSLGRSERIIYYSNISAISYKQTSLTIQGYIQFVLNGTIAKNVNFLKRGWEKELAKDENTIMIKYSSKKLFKKECDDFISFLNSRIN